jgi:tripartite-type tricarboxylate transporter receptor subunit TctC
LIISVNAKLPIHTIAELLAYDAANPGKLNFGYPGTGTMGHMAGSYLAETTGHAFTGVPYQGSAPLARDLVAGTIDIAVDLVPSYIPFIQQGSVRPIAVTSTRRIAELPDVPTVIEQGFKDYEASSFTALFGPPKLPDDIVQKLNAAITGWLQTDVARLALHRQTIRPLGGTPDMLKARVSAEIRKWDPVVKLTHISLD